MVLNSKEPILSLGRNFLIQFGNVEFDFAKHRVRVGPIWKKSVANVHGGEARSRSSTVNAMERKLSDGNWNINPKLDLNHRNIIKELREEYERYFCGRPKVPFYHEGGSAR